MPGPRQCWGKLWQSGVFGAGKLDFCPHVWPVRKMTELQKPYPTDPESLDREYSPSHLVDSLDDYLAEYAERSLAARKLLADKAKIGLKYGPNARHRLDYFHADRPGAPLVVFLHGGFWSALDESAFSFPAPAFIDAGINYASVTYRLAPETSLSGIVADAHLAVAWLSAQAQQLGFDPNRIVIAGHSAGAHLAAMVMTSKPVLKGALLISGVYDLEPVRLSYVNDMVGMNAAEALANSPYTILPNAACAIHIAVGSNETGEFKRQSVLLHTTWKQHLSCSTFMEYEGRDHFNILFDLADPSSTLFGETLNLVNKHAP